MLRGADLRGRSETRHQVILRRDLTLGACCQSTPRPECASLRRTWSSRKGRRHSIPEVQSLDLSQFIHPLPLVDRVLVTEGRVRPKCPTSPGRGVSASDAERRWVPWATFTTLRPSRWACRRFDPTTDTRGSCHGTNTTSTSLLLSVQMAQLTLAQDEVPLRSNTYLTPNGQAPTLAVGSAALHLSRNR